jgi:hypothetical protein
VDLFPVDTSIWAACNLPFEEHA